MLEGLQTRKCTLFPGDRVYWPGYLAIAPYVIFEFERKKMRGLWFFSSFSDGMVRKTQVIVIRDIFSHTCCSERSDCTNVESM